MSVKDVLRNFGIVFSRDNFDSGYFERGIDTIIVDGTGYEPLLETDRFLLERETGNILRGLEYLVGASSAERAFIAVNETYSNAISWLQESSEKTDRINVFPIGDFYPAGDECVLVYEATGRMVPEGGTAVDAACIVIDVESVINISEAVTNDKPVTKNWLTCTGYVHKPSIVRTHIGTPLEDVLALCGGATCDDFGVIVGNPLTGRVETDMKASVEKKMTGIIVLPKDHSLVARKKISISSIIRRSKSIGRQGTICTDLCPRYLLGYDIRVESILNQVNYRMADVDESVIRGVFLCGECRLCDMYSCAPGAILTAFKKMLNEKGYSPAFPKRTLSAHEMREYRKVPNSRVNTRLQIDTFIETGMMMRVETNPALVEIPLEQAGVYSKPIVSAGDSVSEKECIARAPVNGRGSDVHASISGKVIFIDSERIVIAR